MIETITLKNGTLAMVNVKNRTYVIKQHFKKLRPIALKKFNTKFFVLTDNLEDLVEKVGAYAYQSQ